MIKLALTLTLTLTLLCCSILAQSYAPWVRPMQARLAGGVSYGNVPTNGLVAYWSMRTSGTTVYDEWGSNNGTAVNSPTFSAAKGVRDNGAGHNGTNQRISVPVAAFASHNTGTIAAWVKVSQGGAVFAVTKSDAAYRTHLYARTNNLELTNYDIGTGGVNHTGLSNGFDSSIAGIWAHVAVTQSGSGLEFYLDGVSLGVASGNHGYWWNDVTGANAANIGIREINASWVYFGGSIDEVAIWNRALTSNEVHQIYSSPLYLDYKE